MFLRYLYIFSFTGKVVTVGVFTLTGVSTSLALIGCNILNWRLL